MISTTDSAVSYSGNNSTTTAYAVNFPMQALADLKATVTDSDAVTTTYTDLTLTPTYDGNGRIQSASVKTGTAIPATSTIRFYRETAATQTLDLTTGGTLPPEATESALDRATMIAQEARRDAAYSGTPDISVAGNGLVAQVSANSFSARTLGVVDGSPLAITNGSGVDGNPLVGLDLSSQSALSAITDATIFLVKTDAGFLTLTADKFATYLAQTTYKTIEFPASQITPATSNGCTVSADTGAGVQEVTARFPGAATATKGYFKFYIPNDYAGGAILMRFRYLGHSGDSFLSSDAVFNIKVEQKTASYQEFNAVNDWDFAGSGTAVKYTEKTTGQFSGVTLGTLGDPIALGDGYAFGDAAFVEIERDPTDGDDDSSAGGIDRDATIASIVVQYPAQAITSAWS